MNVVLFPDMLRVSIAIPVVVASLDDRREREAAEGISTFSSASLPVPEAAPSASDAVGTERPKLEAPPAVPPEEPPRVAAAQQPRTEHADTAKPDEPGPTASSDTSRAPATSDIKDFGSNKTSTSHPTESLARDVVKQLVADPGLVLVLHGHTDRRGSRASNYRLGLRRARRLRDALVESGAPAARIRVVSHGETKPTTDGRTGLMRAQDRRVELVWERED